MVKANFFVGGLLRIEDDAGNGSVVVSRDAAGAILINGGAVPVSGGVPTVANTTLIRIFGAAGNDTLTIDEANGAMPAVEILAGDGDDTATGGSASDQIYGQNGKDILVGKGGADFLYGGPGTDVLTGGDGDDQMFGGNGNDRMIWNPGDDSDLMEGGADFDRAEINGGNGAETFTITANGARVRFDRTNPAPFAIDIGTTEKLVLAANGGDDVIAAGNGLAALIKLEIDGGLGNDTITGGDGDDLLIGGDGNDTLTGGRGADRASLGAGDDIFVWNPGDGNDIVEGQTGLDTLQFNGANISEKIDISANGARTRFTRDVANIVMDLNKIETINFAALGGADLVTVNDLTGTSVTTANIDLGLLGAGDGQTDVVTLNGRSVRDVVTVAGAGTSVLVSGLAPTVNITNSESGDALKINTLDGDDAIDASTLTAGVASLTIDAGIGNDDITGSQGADTIFAGGGNDEVIGENGNDLALLGAGDDTFVWNPGDGNDTVEGQDGFDTLLFNGSNASEVVNISANGGRALFFRDVGNVTMDVNDVEKIDFRAFGGTDNVVIGDMSGTDVTAIAIDLAGPVGGGDAAVDTVTANGTNGADVFGAKTDSGNVVVFGLAATVTVTNAEAANDRLVLNGQAGDDVIDTTNLTGIAATINGGLGSDVFLGGAGDELFNGGDGNDTALMGAGDDTFVWNPGDDNDTLEGQAGFDTMLFNGANVSEIIDISANGGRVQFFRNVASVAMDLNDVEKIDFRALGGADVVTINDLSGTDVTDVSIDLAGAGGVGDGAADTIIINATNGDDVIQIFGDANGVTIAGLAAQIHLTGFDASDRLVINALGGDDVVEASGLAVSLLTANGGIGADVLIGGSGADILNGDDGDDILLGGPGLDILNGGAGNNVVIQD